ncbi:hypothetical protein [Aureimonas sp. SA4125]|nr:hypothetical protein [Aureimonas sp. SA4125]
MPDNRDYSADRQGKTRTIGILILIGLVAILVAVLAPELWRV